MPVIRFSLARLEELLRGLSREEILELIDRAKGNVEAVEGDYVDVELEVDRPDMYTTEGLARYLRGLLGWEEGPPAYELVETDLRLRVGVVPQRPFVAALVAWDVNVDEEYLKELIQFQEKLHNSLGARRRRLAIGFHDLEKLPSRSLEYRTARCSEVRFKPLHSDKVMSLCEVLEATEQGREYGSIARRGDEHPVLLADGEVIAAPPVINADVTRVEPGTKHLFVDVTGTDLRGVLDAAAVIAANLAERGSRRVGLVLVEAPWGRMWTPDMEPRRLAVEHHKLASWLGAPISCSEAAEALRRARMEAECRGSELLIQSPRWRVDFLHWVDAAEEVAVVKGYDWLPLRRPSRMLRGSLLPTRLWERAARQLLAGYGFVEAYSFTLTSCSDAELAGVDAARVARLENPVTTEMECLRPAITPQLLRMAAANQHRVPLRLFEAGEVVLVDPTCSVSDTCTETMQHLAILIMGERVGYEDVQAVVWGLVRLMGDEVVRVEATRHPLLIEGRAAVVETRLGVRGWLGEVHPEKLEKLGIEYPVAVAELDYTNVKAPTLSE